MVRDWKLRAEGQCLVASMEDSIGNEMLFFFKKKKHVNTHIGSSFSIRPPKEGNSHISNRILNWSPASSITLQNRQE